MTFLETMDWQRVNSAHINRLAKEGDALSMKLINSYCTLHADQLNPEKQSEWMKICDDWFRRDLDIANRRVLNDRFGHKIPGDYKRMDA